MVMPLGFNSFSAALRAGVETFHELKKVLKGRSSIRPSAMKAALPPISRATAKHST